MAAGATSSLMSAVAVNILTTQWRGGLTRASANFDNF